MLPKTQILPLCRRIGPHSPTKIVWSEYLTTTDGKVDLDLVQPTGVDRSMDRNQVGISALETMHALYPIVRGSVVDSEASIFLDGVETDSVKLFSQENGRAEIF